MRSVHRHRRAVRERGRFADGPVYRLKPCEAIVVLTFVHSSDRRADCRWLTPEEIAKLSPNMRRVQDCPRGRRPVYVELDIGSRVAYRASLAPPGIAGDGPAGVYQRFVVPAREYKVAVRMRDTTRAEGFDHEREGETTLQSDQCSSSISAPNRLGSFSSDRRRRNCN